MSTNNHIDVYQVVTDRIIELLTQGTIPWQKPWKGAGQPMNLISKRPYKGINVWLLATMGYDQNLFLTFDQLKQLGGSVIKGEHGHVIVFWKTIKKEDDLEESEQSKKQHSILKYYKVFNVAQCKDIPLSVLPTIEASEFEPMLDCEAIINGMPKCPPIQFKGQKAYYHTEQDFINMPKKKSFTDEHAYYATLFHELIHSTGHASRLNRKTITETHEFGSDGYVREELIAEMGGCYVSNFAGILDNTIKNNAAYIEGWLTKINKDKRLLVLAASQAQRAADYILNFPEQQSMEEVEQPEVLAED